MITFGQYVAVCLVMFAGGTMVGALLAIGMLR